MNAPRYEIAKAGEDEPGVILVLDHESGLVIARSSEIALKHVDELVRLANSADEQREESK